MSQLSTQFCHLVYLVNALTFKEVQAIEVLIIVREEHLVFRSLNRNNCFEDCTFALLNPLSHRVQVCRKVNCCGEDTLAFLTLALAIQLLPPLVHIVKFRLEVNQYLRLLALSIKSITHSSILFSRIFCKRHFWCSQFFHICCALYQSLNVEACTSDRQQTYGSKDRETTTHVVGNNKALITFFVGSYTGSPLFSISYSHNNLASHFDATLLLAVSMSAYGITYDFCSFPSL